MNKVSEVDKIFCGMCIFNKRKHKKYCDKRDKAKHSLLTLLIERLEKEKIEHNYECNFSPGKRGCNCRARNHNNIVDSCISAVKEVFNGNKS
jgi:hypothetical protein